MSWLEALRVQSADAFSQMGGWPTPKHPSWHYTNLAKYWINQQDSPQTASSIPRHTSLPDELLNCQTLAFIDGCSCPGLVEHNPILPQSITFQHLGQLLMDQQEILRPYLNLAQTPLEAYNTARVTDGLLVQAKASKTPQKAPLHIFYGQTEGRSVLRTILHVEKGATLTVIEHYQGHAGYTQPFTNIILEKGATLNHIRVQEAAGSHLAHTTATVATQATFNHTALSLNSSFNRHQMDINLNGAHAAFNMNSVQLVTQSQLSDTTLTIHHNAPHTASSVHNRNVVGGAGHAVFQGKLHVPAQAQHTAANMQCKNMLLSPFARASTKPELEIYADDVACAHGNATGAPDMEALFYLQSRGLTQQEAMATLVQGFIQHILSPEREPSAQSQLPAEIAEWLPTLSTQWFQQAAHAKTLTKANKEG